MKYSYLIIISFLILSCSDGTWTSEESNTFINGCINEGGSKAYCECYLENVMEEYPIAEDSEKMDFETKIELSKMCN